MRRILIFALTYYPNKISGAEEAIQEITDRTNPKEIEFHMVTLRYNSLLPKTEKMGNILVHRVGLTKKNPSFQSLSKLPLDLNKPLYQFLAPLYGLILHHKYHYDAIWSLMAHSAGVPAAIFKTFHPKTKYILTLQEGDPIPYIEKTMQPVKLLFDKAFTSVDKVQAISTFLANWAKNKKVASEKIHVIPNGCNNPDLMDATTDTQIKNIQNRHNKKPGDVWLVNTARLVKQKANDQIIKALTQLPDNIKFIVVGDGPEEEYLKNLSKELKLENRVIFTGNLPQAEAAAYRKSSDIFVCPSRSEGLGNAFLSAMASRLPVIATQEGGLAEFIFDTQKNPDKETTAWAVDKDRPEQISAAVKNILSNPEKTKQVVSQARKMIEEKYTWDVVSQRMQKEIFNQIF